MGLHPIFLQAIFYGVVLLMSLGFIGMVQRGFFWKFMKVRLSFGKFLMVKIRAVNRDYFRVGRIEENDLLYKLNRKDEKRLNIDIKDKDVFYKSIGVLWVDVDDQKNAVVKPNFSTVQGFDAVKQNNLLQRALTKPAIIDNKDKVIIGILVITLLMVIICIFFLYQMSNEQLVIRGLVNTIQQQIQKGSVIPAGNL